ncbi:ATP-binding protein [Kutzneria sp. CA-103260]|uniref:ATP-binding protein n=1 Tax=Kutzneria sp. CA-103260 TaxID=2802641 RepID=UPI001BAB9A88|nr:ATP-binding protein [Kutzneria sp. CA-103260]QUQ66659.1 hypothetical protein JJ691_43870 [Kutzneria sp. CA-103260]
MRENCLLRLGFTAADLPMVRVRVAESLLRAGVSEPVRRTFVQAALEVACNAVVHGGGSGHLELCLVNEELRCEITDRGVGVLGDDHSQDMSSHSNPGLRLARALTGRLELCRDPESRVTTARLAVRLEAVSS